MQYFLASDTNAEIYVFKTPKALTGIFCYSRY